MLKVRTNIDATIIDDLFTICYLRYNLHSKSGVHPVCNGQNSMQYSGPLI